MKPLTRKEILLDKIANSNLGVSGTKNITENGDYDVARFASAHVAVPSGGGGGETATVNFINSAENTTYSILLPVISAEGVTLTNEDVEGNENNFTIPINNGSFAISFSYLEDTNPEVMPTVTGDIQLDFENGLIIITGDGTFTAAGIGEG